MALTNKITVEFGDDHGRNFVLGTLQIRVRGRFSLSEMMGREDGAGVTPGEAMSAMPTVPGMEMTIHCREMKYVLHDPLSDDKQKMERVNRVLSRALVANNVDGVSAAKDSGGALNPDTLVTLIAELQRMEANGSVTVKSGDWPSKKALDEYEGKELNDPFNTSAHKPRYKADQAAYASKIAQTRG